MNIFNRLTPRYITLLLSFMTIFLLFTQNLIDNTVDSFDDSIFEASCSCKSCVMGFMDDDWFIYRYDPSIPPLLNRKNSELRRDTYRWGRGLQPSMFRVNYTKVVDQMFSLFPDEEHYSDAGPDRCRTCAVVGNSANLLGSHYGSLIDFHDVVIRINKSPPKGYERDMGSKTTHRILYPESAVDFDNSTHLVTFTTRHITRYPSTGFITIIFALHICDQVKLFAFSMVFFAFLHCCCNITLLQSEAFGSICSFYLNQRQS
uniref:ST3 beta-galactoside alpha-2,3-sialyltransferase 1 n=1 Tax=Sinocyclocheilus anshuiensis TaxID=1608454 RepID=A0A671M8N0_9TELE